MKTVKISKAQPIGDQKIENVTIEIWVEFPDIDSVPMSKLQHLSEASDLELALYNALPGGTYDRLLGLMLARKATHFVVAHGELEQITDDRT